MGNTKAANAAATDTAIRHAPRYAVVLHNDDYTTDEFVVRVLKKFFFKTDAEATSIMLLVHTKGHGVVGLFSKDWAETKALQVTTYAKQNQMPLKVTAEPDGQDS